MPNPRSSIAAIIGLAAVGFGAITLGHQSNSTAQTNLTVLGAASLTEVLPELGRAFQSTNPGVKFNFSLAGSSTLAQQIVAGAPADLFFAAGSAPMSIIEKADQIKGRPKAFASNSLVIAVPPNNPAMIRSLADLARPGVTFILCAPQVPCGSASAKVLTLARVTTQPVSFEHDVKSVLTKVALGEADAGLVYRTDITKAVTSIDFPESNQAINKYLVAIVSGSRHEKQSLEFIDFVLGPRGQQILQQAGFAKP